MNLAENTEGALATVAYWMYGTKDAAAYLKKNFGSASYVAG